MSFLSSPKILYVGRIIQLILGVLFLVLICYDGTHRSWWTGINGALAVGVIASIFTFAVSVHTIFTHHRSNPFSGGSAMYTIARLLAEIVVFLLWIAAAGVMIRDVKHPGGCENFGPDTNHKDGPNYCWRVPFPKTESNPRRYDSRPLKTWDTAIAAALVEA
ncbi:MAG: hypothetical protein LQ350_001788 [Teloschistes chrysophthalmus]|nr:MAG: hypothetical protein LQ350_001788 [Niorma chrysophthalma]